MLVMVVLPLLACGIEKPEEPAAPNVDAVAPAVGADCDEDQLRRQGGVEAFERMVALGENGGSSPAEAASGSRLGPFCCGPEGMGGIYNVKIERIGGGGPFDGVNRVNGPAHPDPMGLPTGGLEGLCLNGGTYPYLSPNSGTPSVTWDVSHRAVEDVPDETKVRSDCPGSKKPNVMDVARCDVGGSPCPTMLPAPTTVAPTDMIGPGIYHVAAHSVVNPPFGGTVNPEAIVIVREVQGHSDQRVETWCYDKKFFWPNLYPQQGREGDAANSYWSTTHKIEMTDRTPACTAASQTDPTCVEPVVLDDCDRRDGVVGRRFDQAARWLVKKQ